MKNHGLDFFKTQVFCCPFQDSVSLKDKLIRGMKNQPFVYVNLKRFLICWSCSFCSHTFNLKRENENFAPVLTVFPVFYESLTTSLEKMS